ncbi:MAG TPA: NYN domain-containing protein [Jatrophihabitantaceae bacterium]|jgi:predicted RNA-binding protein with PIN domain
MAASPQPREDDEPVVLSEAARQQLVTIAADLVGRLAADELPVTLRPVARFTPSKRVRLGGTQLAAALDADEAFRARVADTVAEALPQLAAAVRAGESTTASDPVDTAVVAYLLRPDGWPAIIAEANARYTAEREQAGSAASAAEVAQLRAQLAELKARLRTEAAQAKAALAHAVAAAESEVADLRKQLRVRIGELRAAQRGRDEAEAQAADATRKAEAAEATRDAETRRLRARIAELERAAEAARRGARTERDIDEARLWLLVDTVTEAAAGIRRELSLAAPTLRPADTVASAESSAQRRAVSDPAALDALLLLPNAHLIVDGYNVTKTGYGELPLADQRARLVNSLAAVAARSGAEITIAFDGGQRPPTTPPGPRGVRVLFSAADEIADDLIRRLVDAEPAGRPLLVVSSDRQVAQDAARAGAWTADSAVLLARI